MVSLDRTYYKSPKPVEKEADDENLVQEEGESVEDKLLITSQNVIQR